MSEILGVSDYGFQWSTSEQVWPFEKASDGSTLHCKQIDFGALPNTGGKEVAHGVTGIQIHSFGGYIYDANNKYPLAYAESSSFIALPFVKPDYVRFNTNNNFSTLSAIFRIIYAKS